MAALRDLGALPMDTDIDAVIRDLRLDEEVIDPTTLTGEEMVEEDAGAESSRPCSATAPSSPRN